jgi:hypothetical protein
VFAGYEGKREQWKTGSWKNFSGLITYVFIPGSVQESWKGDSRQSGTRLFAQLRLRSEYAADFIVVQIDFFYLVHSGQNFCGSCRSPAAYPNFEDTSGRRFLGRLPCGY